MSSKVCKKVMNLNKLNLCFNVSNKSDEHICRSADISQNFLF